MLAAGSARRRRLGPIQGSQSFSCKQAALRLSKFAWEPRGLRLYLVSLGSRDPVVSVYTISEVYVYKSWEIALSVTAKPGPAAQLPAPAWGRSLAVLACSSLFSLVPRLPLPSERSMRTGPSSLPRQQSLCNYNLITRSVGPGNRAARTRVPCHPVSAARRPQHLIPGGCLQPWMSYICIM